MLQAWACPHSWRRDPPHSPPRDTRTVGADLLRDLFTGGGDGYVVNDLGVRLQGANGAEP